MDEDPRSCWVCYATDQDDDRGYTKWIRPCKCRGATKWVHQHCLQRWIDEKQRGDSTAKVTCRACNTEYIICYPEAGFLLRLMEFTDTQIYRVSPFLAGGLLMGSVYWTAVTYGAVTVMQVLGHQEGLYAMEKADPLFLLIGLPTLPVVLVLGKMIRWEEYLLRAWRKYSSKLPIVSYFTPKDIPEWRHEYNVEFHVSQPQTTPRVLCGALLFPTIATIVGKLLFRKVNSNVKRTVLGGLLYLTLKGALKVMYLQQKYLRACRREIMDYPESTE